MCKYSVHLSCPTDANKFGKLETCRNMNSNTNKTSQLRLTVHCKRFDCAKLAHGNFGFYWHNNERTRCAPLKCFAILPCKPSNAICFIVGVEQFLRFFVLLHFHWQANIYKCKKVFWFVTNKWWPRNFLRSSLCAGSLERFSVASCKRHNNRMKTGATTWHSLPSKRSHKFLFSGAVFGLAKPWNKSIKRLNIRSGC